jgi:hypothetical protein
MGKLEKYRNALSAALHRLDAEAEAILLWTHARLQLRTRRILFLLMALVFISGLGFSVFRNPSLLVEANLLAFAAIALVSFPAVLATSIARYQLLALASGKNITFRSAARIVVTGIAANVLPLPGGIIVRAAGLTENGKGFTRATRYSLAATLLWIGVATVFSSAFAIYLELLLFGATGLIAGSILILGGWRAFPKDVVHGIPSRIMATNLILMGFMTFQYWLAFAATGESIGVEQAAFLTICGPIGVVVAIAPAGIGVTEVSAAALSTLVGVDPARAFVALALSRIAQSLVATVVAWVLRAEAGR